MTDNEIIKAKSMLKKLEEAYEAYYDTSKGMPYDIDVTLRETAICLENALDEINRQKAEIERLHELLDGWKKVAYKTADEKDEIYCNAIDRVKTAKAEAVKECIEKIKARSCKRYKQSNGIVVAGSANYTISETELYNIVKEMVGDV